MQGRSTRIVALVAAIAAMFALGAAPAFATGGATRVTLITEGQRSAFVSGQLVTRVAATRAGTVRVAASRLLLPIATPRTVTFDRAGAKNVTLTLNTRGRAMMLHCDSPLFGVRSTLLGNGGSTWIGLRRLASDLPRCRNAGNPGTPPVTTKPAPVIDVSNADRCDFLVPARCLMPFPNDYFTTADASTATGRRVALNPASMPKTKAGVVFDPTDINHNDGFSPGAQITLKVPGLDNEAALAQTNPVGLTDLARYAEGDAPIVVINARTGKRQPIWAELDSHATTDADRALLVRPATNFEEGTRYVVALRRLKNSAGQAIPAGDAFRIYRDRLASTQPEVNGRRGAMERTFADLKRADIDRDDLYLAWDFTVASARSLTERVLTMRDDAFASLGDPNLADMQVQGTAPPYEVTSVEDFTEAQDAQIRRRVLGTFTVPCYITPDCLPSVPGTNGKRFTDPDGDGIPERTIGADYKAEFRCDLPRKTGLLRPSLYGHGLLGSYNEMNQGQLKSLANNHGFMFCATKWIGISDEDFPFDAGAVQNYALFPAPVARMQQGMLDFLFLGRLMIHPQGLVADTRFRGTGGEAVIDTRRLFYDGNSQGGIMGGALAAIAPDHNRAVLGVPGMNYSVLLPRSVDFDALRDLSNLWYTDELERPLIYALVQMGWDRGESNGYAQHMTRNPLPNTPAHEVLLHVAFGDHQVSNYSAEVEARTIGARVHRPLLDPGRHWATNPLWDVPSLPAGPYDGSALVYWDSGAVSPTNPQGTPGPPLIDQPPRVGQDPHEYPRRTPAAQEQKSQFLQIDGRVVNTCGAAPCYSNGFTGAP